MSVTERKAVDRIIKWVYNHSKLKIRLVQYFENDEVSLYPSVLFSLDEEIICKGGCYFTIEIRIIRDIVEIPKSIDKHLDFISGWMESCKKSGY
jgi:hypothetical protein